MHRANWDDLRFVLAVAECGSVSAASRLLGVNHATVLRRIATFEEAHGAAVFDRSAQGYAILPDKLRVIDAARRASLAMEQVGELLRGAGGTREERIRVTSTDTFCQTILPKALAMVPQELGQIELCSSNEHVDMSRLRADVTVRPAVQLPPELSGEIAGEFGFAVYARRGVTPTGWLGLFGMLERTGPAAWMAKSVDPSLIVGGADSFPVLREIAAASDSRAIMPCVLGDADERLVRLDDDMPAIRVPLWVACHVDLAQVPSLMKFRKSLVEALRRMDGIHAVPGEGTTAA